MEESTLIVRPSVKEGSDLAAWISAGFFALVALLGCVLFARRAAGALAEPLPTAVLGGIGLLLAVWSLTIGREAPHVFQATTAQGWGAWSRRIVLALTAFSLSLPGVGVAGLLALWAPLVAAEVWAGWRPAVLHPGSSQPMARIYEESVEEAADEAAETPSDESPLDARDDAGHDDTDHSGESDFEELDLTDAIQTMIRRRDAEGVESVSGWLRADFAAGEQTIVAYLAFCPPLADLAPQFSAEGAEGPPVDIKPTRVASHGARLEIKRGAPAEAPASARIEFSAWTSRASGA